MKTKNWIILFAAVLLVCVGISIPTFLPGEAATHAEIISDGTLLQTLDLRRDCEFQVSVGGVGYNLITVKDGKIAVTEASCPDHYCMHRGYCNGGADIVCLPNRLVIRFVGEQTIDAVVG